MKSINLPLRKLAWAIYLEVVFPELLEVFEGTAELDESYIREKEINKYEDKNRPSVRETVGKSAVCWCQGLDKQAYPCESSSGCHEAIDARPLQ